ncbi:MAG TPA: hypothetical protein VEJ36_03750 [Nitrososphaerales archaeon]|nr:hypothetical protein [Nitrososphaerales archaeon]
MNPPIHRRRAVETIVVEMLLVIITLISAVALAGFVFGFMGSTVHPAEVQQIGMVISRNIGIGPLDAACSSADSGSFILVTNRGVESAVLTSLTITYSGSTSTLALGGSACEVPPNGELYVNLLSIGTAHFSSGQPLEGSLGLSNGGLVPLAGSFG